MKEEHKEAFLEAIKRAERGKWPPGMTSSYIYSIIQSPFLNKKAIREGIEMLLHGSKPEKVWRQLDFVRRREIDRHRKRIAKKNEECLTRELKKVRDADPDMFDDF